MKQRHVTRWVVLVLVTLGAIAAGVNVILRGVSARDQPTAAETLVARTARHLAIPAKWRAMPNPVSKADEAIDRGLRHFADHCATCHGNDGKGNTSLGNGMYPPPPDMTLAATQDMSDGEIYAIIQNGVRLTGMPAFGEGRTDDEETWNLVHFIRHLPDLTGEELVLMESLNPKTPAELAAAAEEEAFLSGAAPEKPAPDAEPNHQH